MFSFFLKKHFNKIFIAGIGLLFLNSCQEQNPRPPISRKSHDSLKTSIVMSKQIKDYEESLILNYIKKDSTHTYKKSGSGFWYTVLTTGISTNKKPVFEDVVNFEYNIKTMDNQILYSKKELGVQNYVMDKQMLFTGLREGLKLLNEGESARFLFPSIKAYGYFGDEKKITSNMPLISEVSVHTVLKIKNKH